MTEVEADKPSLIATGGPLDGTVFVVSPGQEAFTLGSATTANAKFELANVAVEHARLSVGARGLVLKDVGSQSGTYVNGEKIEGEHVLHDGDRICLGPPGSKGSAKLLVRLPAAWAPPDDDDDDLVLVKPKPEMGLEPVPEKPAPQPPPPPPPPPPPIEPPGPMAAPPPPPPPPPPAFTEPPAPRAAEPRKKAEYTDEPPSILGSARSEPVHAPARVESAPREDKPAAKKKAPRAGRIRGTFPTTAVLIALGVAALGGGGYWASTNLFKKVPAITGVVPPKVEPGRSVTISGTGFDSEATSNTVRFGNEVAVVTSATDTQLTVTVPTTLGAEVSQVPVVVETRGGKSNAGSLMVFRPPQVSGVQPDVALPGETVVITGGNLDGKPLTVNIGGMAAEVKEAEPGTLKVVVPNVPVSEGRTTPVHVQVGSESAKPVDLLIGRLPLVLEVAPPQGAAGDRVVLKGRGFDATTRGNVVLFGEEPALLLAASPTEITVAAPKAPQAETQSKVPVIVKAGGASSSGTISFVATRLSAASFVPHFFATTVPDDAEGSLAFVATDLGPVFVLGGKGEAASVAERAVRTAAALNALMKRPEGPPAFELRKDPDPAVGVVGTQAALLTVTPEDAAAYGRAWDGARAAKRGGASPRFLAQYWTALLQDYATLFVTKKRPIKVLEMSPRGKVLADLYAEAVRSAGADAGVPSQLVLPTSPALAKGLREMALLLPAEGQTRAGATIEGRWDGTLQEGGATRDIQVRFRYEGSRLTGSLSSRRGTLDMQTPLRDVALDKGTLRFAVDLSGSALYFRGTVEGQAVSGTIGKSASEKAPPGSFTLKFVE